MGRASGNPTHAPEASLRHAAALVKHPRRGWSPEGYRWPPNVVHSHAASRRFASFAETKFRRALPASAARGLCQLTASHGWNQGLSPACSDAIEQALGGIYAYRSTPAACCR